MINRKEEKQMPYSSSELYDLVADVASYPSFLPWCLGATILEKSETHMVADLTVGKGLLKDTFRSHVFLKAPSSIEVHYKNGPLKKLETSWTFETITPSSSLVKFSICLDFENSTFNNLMSLFFQQAFSSMMGAFEKEAEKRYGET